MHLLIDGKNLLYRGIYASLNTQIKDHFVVISRMMHSYLHHFSPQHVHIFWDDHKDNLWRKDILSDYKVANCREKSSIVEDKIILYQTICEEVWENMNIRQYKRSRMEADDLIYAFCAVIRKPTVVVSNDSDMIQLIYKFNHVQIFNPSKKIVIDRPDYDPVTVKCLNGDVSDNIKGYFKIGPVKAEKCARDLAVFRMLLHEKGADRYHQNRKLIDLSMCPEVVENMTYIIEELSKEIKFDKKLIIELLYRKHKIKGIMTEFKTVISPFKMIGG